MVKNLILIRHGKAEPGSLDQLDEERRLTPQGLDALRAPTGFARSASLMDDSEREHAQVWVSPAVRTHQTALALLDVIGERPLVEKGCLWEQDSVAFLDELEQSDAQTVIAVGHIPFMNDMVELLSGACIGFKPGAMAKLSLRGPLQPGCADLSWFVQGPIA